jgi:hypothetical protein
MCSHIAVQSVYIFFCDICGYPSGVVKDFTLCFLLSGSRSFFVRSTVLEMSESTHIIAQGDISKDVSQKSFGVFLADGQIWQGLAHF